MQDIAVELRWILLASGVVLILALAVFGRKRRQAISDSSVPRAMTPTRQQSMDTSSHSNTAPSRRAEAGAMPTVIMDDYEDRSPSLGDISHLNLSLEHNEPSFEAPTSSASVRSLNLDANTSDVADMEDLDNLAHGNDFKPIGSAQTPMVEAMLDSRDEMQQSDSLSLREVNDDGASNYSNDDSSAIRDPKLTASRTTESSHYAKTIDLDVEQQVRRSAARNVARRIITLRLSFDEKRVAGSLLRQCLHYEHLVYGKYNIFHRMDDTGLAMFSIASMVEPGVFDLTSMNDTMYPGVTFFMQLPGAHDATSTYDEMLGCARNLEEALDGVLQDEQGIALSPLRAERLREEIIDFQHISGAASAASTARNLHT